jgi:cytochrome c biogenesis protein CcdA
MTHLPYIVAVYTLGVLVPVGYALAAFTRLGAAKRRLAALDPRLRRESRP